MKRPLKKEQSRERVLSPQEIRSLWNELDNEYLKGGESRLVASIFKLMLLTGQRGKEVKLMEWSEIDFETQVWTIPGSKTKNKKAHTVPLSNQVIKILKEIRLFTNSSNWAFPSKKTKGKSIVHYQKAIQRIRKQVKISYVGHDQRRTLSTMMAQIGIAPHIIEKVINHTDGNEIGAIYNRYSYEMEKRDALQRLADHLFCIVTVDNNKAKTHPILALI